MREREAKGILVTGGLGYVGGWITSRLAAAGRAPFVLSRGAARPDLGGGYSLVSADVAALEPEELAERLPENLEAVVHAASLNEEFEAGYARKALLVNALGTRNLLEALRLNAARRPGAALPLCMYLSTFHVYGVSEGRISELDPPAPRNHYALTHFFAEEYCRLYQRAHGLPLIVLRLTNGYGPARTAAAMKWHLLLNDMCRSAARRGEIILRSDPSTPRDFVWMGDVARVIESLIDRPDLAGRLFNVSAGRSLSIGRVAALAAKTASELFGREVPLTCERPDTGLAPLNVSNEALCAALGLEFEDHLAEAMRGVLLLATEE